VNKNVGEQDNILLLIGELRTPIQKALGTKKQQIKAWIGDGKQAHMSEEPELLLRAYLSVGESPRPQILQAPTIARALELGDILRHAKRLCLILQNVEATSFFVGLRTNLQQSATPQESPRLIRKILSAIKKWLEWVDSNDAGLTEGTEKALLDIFFFLISQATPSKSMSGRLLRNREKTISPLIDLLLNVIKKSVYAENLIRTLKQLEVVGQRFSSSFVESILDSDIGRQFLDRVLESVPSYVGKAANEGRVDRLEEMGLGVRSCNHAFH